MSFALPLVCVTKDCGPGLFGAKRLPRGQEPSKERTKTSWRCGVMDMEQLNACSFIEKEFAMEEGVGELVELAKLLYPNELVAIEVVIARLERWREILSPPAPPRRKPLAESLRWDVLEADDFTCQGCGARRNLTVDHIIAVANGGTDDRENLQTLCRSCNSRKGAK